MINKVLDEFSDSGTITRVARIEIDLGSIPLKQFEYTVESKLKEELRRSLRKVKSEVEVYPDVNNASFSKTEQSLELLSYYLKNGVLPWWAHRSKKFSMEALLVDLLTNNTERTIRLLRKLGQATKIRSRIVKQFEEKVLLLIVKKLAPVEVAFIKEYILDLKEVHQKKPIAKSSQKEFSEALWEVILSYLFYDKGTRFNSKEFLRWNIKRLATFYKVSYEDLLAKLNESVKWVAHKLKFKSELPTLIKEIASEDIQPKATDIDLPKNNNAQAVFEWVLQNRSFYRSEAFTSLKQLWSIIFLSYRRSAAAIIRAYAKRRETRAYIIGSFSEKELTQIVITLEPSHANFIIEYLETATSVVNKNELDTGNKKEFRESVWDMIISYLVNHSGTRFNQKEFLRGSIYQLAIRYRITYEEILYYFVTLVTQSSKEINLTADLPTLIQELYQDYLTESISLEEDTAPTLNFNTIEQYDLIEELRFYLKQGISRSERAKRIQLYSYLFEQSSTQIEYFLRSSLPSKDSTYRMSQDITKALFRSFLQVMVPREYKQVYQLWQMVKGGFGKYKKMSLKEQRVYFQAILQVVINRKENAYKYIISTIYELATTMSSMQETDIVVAIEESTGESFKQLPISTGIQEIVNAIGKTYSDNKNELVASLELEQVVQILHFYLEGEQYLYIHKKRVSFQDFLPLLMKYQDKAVMIFFKKTGNTFTQRKAHQLHQFYNQTLSILEKKSISLSKADRLIKEIAQQKKSLLNKESKGNVEVLKRVFAWLEGKRIDNSIKSESEFLECIQYAYENFERKFREFILYHIQSGKRLSVWTHQVSDQVLIRILHIVNPKTMNQQLVITQWIVETWNTYQNKRSDIGVIRARSWEIFFRFQLTRSASSDYRYLVHYVFIELFEESKQSQKEERFLKENILSSIAKNKKLQSKKQLVKIVEHAIQEVQKEKESISKVKNEIDPDIEKEALDHLNWEETGSEQEGDPLYIQNSGLIILSAFLPRYYDRLSLVEGKKFKDQDSIYKAIHLLQYLATGSIEHYEYDLSLNKVLCGLPISEPVPYHVELTKEELEISDSLLNAAIQQWEAIGSTSIDGFRGAFLMREGKLESKDEFWRLTVEVKGYDMLLEKLPWSISMLMHPWMKKRIHVEWR